MSRPTGARCAATASWTGLGRGRCSGNTDTRHGDRACLPRMSAARIGAWWVKLCHRPASMTRERCGGGSGASHCNGTPASLGGRHHEVPRAPATPWSTPGPSCRRPDPSRPTRCAAKIEDPADRRLDQEAKPSVSVFAVETRPVCSGETSLAHHRHSPQALPPRTPRSPARARARPRAGSAAA